MAGMELALVVPGIDKATEDFKALGRAAREAADGAEAAKRALRITGPNTRLEQARSNIFQAAIGGDVSSAQSADLFYNLQRAQAQVDRINRVQQADTLERTMVMPGRNIKDTLEKTMRLPASLRGDLDPTQRLTAAQLDLDRTQALPAWQRAEMRRNSRSLSSPSPSAVPNGQSGGGFDIASLLSASANPYVLLGSAALKAASQLGEMTDRAAKATEAFANERFISGGTNAEAARLGSYGIGSGTSRAIMERIAYDPYAAAFAGRAGVHSLGGPLGTLDSASGTLKLVDALRAMSPEMQQRTMRAIPELERPEIIRLLRLTNETMERLRDDARLTKTLMSDANQRKASEYDVSKERREQAMQNVGTKWGQRFMPIGTDVNNGIADTLNYNTRHDPLDLIYAALFDHKQLKEWEKEDAERMRPSKARERTQTIQEKQLQISQDQLQALYMIHGTLGGGERTNRALPSALNGPLGRGDALNRASEMDAINMGMV